MNHLKVNPVGLDATLHRIQVRLYDKLSALWEVNMDGYPRCYSVKRESKKTIEYYMGRGEYLSLIHAEKNKFFFLADNDYEQKSINTFSARVDLYFILNLSQCKKGLLHRGDEEVRRDVVNVLSTFDTVGENLRIITGIDAVFMGFQRENIDDMHPYYYMKISMIINYFSLNDKLC